MSAQSRAPTSAGLREEALVESEDPRAVILWEWLWARWMECEFACWAFDLESLRVLRLALSSVSPSSTQTSGGAVTTSHQPLSRHRKTRLLDL
jgi:hypothetical protein